LDGVTVLRGSVGGYKNHGEAVYIINSAGIAYHPPKSRVYLAFGEYIIKPQEDAR
jgi:hypothetical protein